MRKPTIKQRRAMRLAVENGGNVSRAMREAGYSPQTAKNPSKLTETIGWEQLLEKYLPDELLALKAFEGLEATTVKTSLTEPDKTIPDYSVRQRYLETALKMKNKIIDKKDLTSNGKEINPLLVKFIDGDSNSN